LGLTVGLPITGKSSNRVDLIMPGSLAAKAGLKIGDKIMRIGEKPTKDGGDVVNIIHGSAGKPLDILVQREDKMVVLHATPKLEDAGKGKREGRLGFVMTAELKRVGLRQSVKYGTLYTKGFIETIVVVIFSKQVTKNVGGPIAIANETKTSVQRGWNGYLQLMAVLSLSLGIFNLLPIPVVDGGQMVLVAAEGVKRRKLSQRTLEIAQYIGLAAIALLFVLIMFLDISRVVDGQFFR
ncbi:MAG TPA: M50 family metallopeptidase, partial [Chloroflexota bacterium]|nr:M50 family metallopeptidase [Chloroflexota bacterium]